MTSSLALEHEFTTLVWSLNLGDMVYPISSLPCEKSRIAEAILANAKTEFSIARQMGNDSFAKMTFENAERNLQFLAFFSEQIEAPTPLMELPTFVSVSLIDFIESYLMTLEQYRDQA